MGLSQVEKLHWHPIQGKQKSRGVTTASLDFLVSIVQAVHNLLMLCDSPFLIGWETLKRTGGKEKAGNRADFFQ